MREVIKQSDLSLILQRIQDISMKLEILDKGQTVINTIYAYIIDGSFQIDSDSNMRRTCTLTLMPEKASHITLKPDSFLWLDKSVKISVGVRDIRTGQSIWYSQGYYYFKDASSNYDAVTNTLQLSCGDYMMILDGAKNGAMKALQTTIPAYEEVPETGKPTKHNTIRNAIIQTLEKTAGIKKHMIDDIGMSPGMPQHNEDWEDYRRKNPLWNAIPHDYDFAAGCSVFSILETLRDIYPGYEMYFDTDNTFICRMIPACYEDALILDNEYIQKILISEDFSVDMSAVRNVCEVWGKSHNVPPKYFSANISYANKTYHCAIEKFENYSAGNQLAITAPAANEDFCYLQVNELKAIPIRELTSGSFLSQGTLEPGKTYVFRINRLADENGDAYYAAYLLGQWMPHALNALVDGTVSREQHKTEAGELVPKYSEAYFRDVYQCDTVTLTVIPDSPFTVQKLGEILDVKSGGGFDDISADSDARDCAVFENWKNSRLPDSITITTRLIPFLDVNTKCSYRRSDQDITHQYIIKSLSHNFASGTTTWDMMRFYPSDNMTAKSKGTHQTLSDYPHRILGLYTHQQLQQLAGRTQY